MAVTAVKLLFSGITGRDDIKGLREYVQKWGVTTDNANDGPSIVKAAAGTPQYGQYYQTSTESDSRAFLAERDCEPLSAESSQAWVLTCHFSTHAYSDQGDLFPPVVAWTETQPILEYDFHEQKEPAYFAYQSVAFLGKNFPGPADGPDGVFAIVNSAADLYDPPLEYDSSILILRVEKNQADFNSALGARYANAINSDMWLGWNPCTVKFKPPKAKHFAQDGISGFAVTYEFWFNYRGWFEYRFDAGLREYLPESQISQNPGPGQKKEKPGYYHIKNDDGTFITEPVLLNGGGRRLVEPGGKRDFIALQKNAVINRFRLQEKLPFSQLGIL